MARLNIGYDLLTYEGDILRLHFWAHAFEILKAQGAVFLQTEGKLAGCWVMRIEEADERRRCDECGRAERTRRGIAREGHRPLERRRHLRRQGHREPVLEVRPARPRFPVSPLRARRRERHSTLVGDDVRRGRCPARRRSAARDASTTSSIRGRCTCRRCSARRCARSAIRTKRRTRSTSRTRWWRCRTRRRASSATRSDGEDAKKPFVEVSGRKGLGVKIDDLLDLLTTKASAEVAKRNPGIHARGMPARRRADRGRGDPLLHAEVLARQADCVRHRGGAQLRGRDRAVPAVRRRPRQQHPAQAAGAREAVAKPTCWRRSTRSPADELIDEPTSRRHDLWAVVFEASRLDDVVEQVVRALEFSVLAKYAFGLAQMFNAFYHRYPILNEEDADRKRWRAAGVAYVRAQLTRALDLMGIDVPRSRCNSWPSLRISHAAASSRTTGRRFCTSAARRASSIRRWPSSDALAGVDGLMLTGGDDVAPSRYGEPAHRDGRRGRARTRRVRDRADQPAARSRNLPIFAICRGIQVLNVACGGTLVQDIPSQMHGRADAQPGGAAASAVRARARSVGRQRFAAREADARAAGRRGRVRGEQPPSSGGEGRRARASASRRPRPTASSKRSKIPRRASASASSGTRRTSCAPASSARCSKVSWKRRRTFENLRS